MTISIGTPVSSGNLTSATSASCGSITATANTKIVVAVLTGYDSSATDSAITSFYGGQANANLTLDRYYRSGSGFLAIYHLQNVQAGSLSIQATMAGTCTDLQMTCIPVNSDQEVDILFDNYVESTSSTTSHAVTVSPAKSNVITIGGIVALISATTGVTNSVGTLVSGSESDMGNQVAEVAYNIGSASLTWGKSSAVASYAVAATFYESLSPTTALGTPANAATNVSSTPALTFTGTDANGDQVDYQVQIDTVNTFSNGVTPLSTLEIARRTGSWQVANSSSMNPTLLYDNGFIYGSTTSIPGSVVKFDRKTLAIKASKSYNTESVYGIHAYDANYVYFTTVSGTTYTLHRLSKSDWTTLNSKVLPDGYNVVSMTQDANYVYGAVYVSPAVVLRINKSDWNTVTYKTLASGENYSSGIENDASYVYISTGTNPSKVVRLAKSDFTSETAIAPTPVGTGGAIVDDGTYLYVSIKGSPSYTSKIRKSDFTEVAYASTNLTNSRSLVQTSNYLYSIESVSSTPAKIARVKKSDLSVAGNYTAPTGYDQGYGLTIDPSTTELFFTLWQANYPLCRTTPVERGLITAFSTEHTGFSAGASHPTNSGVQQTYTVQTPLTPGTTYYWRVASKDPTGSNDYGAWSETRSFTVSNTPSVTINSPADNGNLTSTVTFTGTDPESQGIVYRAQIDTANTFDKDPRYVVADAFLYSNTGQQFNTKIGQSFTPSSTGVLAKAAFSLGKQGSPTGTFVARIYTHAGTYGSTSIPSEICLATSDAVDVSAIPANGLTVFTFTGANKVTLQSGVNYVVAAEYTSTFSNGSNYIIAGVSTINYVAGNMCTGNSVGWYQSSYDMEFMVLYDNPKAMIDATSDNDSGFVNLTNGGNTSPFTSGNQIQYTIPATFTYPLETVPIEKLFSLGIAYSASSTFQGQGFTAKAGVLDKAKFWIHKQGSPTGNIEARLYRLSDKVLLATSDVVDLTSFSNIAESTPTEVTFNFSGGNRITLVDNTQYIIGVYYANGVAGTTIQIPGDTSGTSVPGINWYLYNNGWMSSSFTDLLYSIYIVASTLPSNTVLYWRAAGKDPSGSNQYGTWSSTNHSSTTINLVVADATQTHNSTTVTIAYHPFGYAQVTADNASQLQNSDNVTIHANVPPTVALQSPSDTSSTGSARPSLEFIGTDTESNPIRYEIMVSDNPDFINGTVTEYSPGIDPNYYYSHIDVNPITNDVVVALEATGIYKQTGGSGNFVKTVDINYFPRAICFNSATDDVYVVKQGGDGGIYKQTDGAGSLVQVGPATQWEAIGVDTSNNSVYAYNTSDFGGYVRGLYKQTNGSGNFNLISNDVYYDSGIHSLIVVNPSTHDVYVTNFYGRCTVYEGGTSTKTQVHDANFGSNYATAFNIDFSTGDVYYIRRNKEVMVQYGGTGNFTFAGYAEDNETYTIWGTINTSAKEVLTTLYSKTIHKRPLNLIYNSISGTDPGFTDLTTGDTDPFNSGDRVAFVPDKNFKTGKTYYWKVRGTDPGFSNQWGNWSSVWSFSISSATVLAPGATAHSHTAENIALVQHNNLTVQSASMLHTADQLGAFTLKFALTVADNTLLHVAESFALTVKYALTVQFASMLHSVESPPLTQHSQITVQDASQLHTAENVTLTAYGAHYSLTVQDTTQTIFSGFTYTVTDDFNRDDGNLGSNWTERALAVHQVRSNKIGIVPDNSNTFATYNGTFENDQYAQARYVTAGQTWGALVVRGSGVYSSNNVAGYTLWVSPDGLYGFGSPWPDVSGWGYLLWGGSKQTPGGIASGDMIRFEVTGQDSNIHLKFFLNGNLVEDYLVGEHQSEPTNNSGNPGIQVFAGYFDDFSAGYIKSSIDIVYHQAQYTLVVSDATQLQFSADFTLNFPSNLDVLDNFNREDSANLGPNWTDNNNLTVNDMNLHTETGGYAIWSSTMGADIELYVDIPTLSASSRRMYLFYDYSWTPVQTGYVLEIICSTSSISMKLYENAHTLIDTYVVNGTFSGPIGAGIRHDTTGVWEMWLDTDAVWNMVKSGNHSAQLKIGQVAVVLSATGVIN